MLNDILLLWCLVSDYQDDEEVTTNITKSSTFKIEGEKALKYVMINRTRPKTCDRVVNLFTLAKKVPENVDYKNPCHM